MAKEACTRLKVSTNSDGHSIEDNLQRTGGPNRFLVSVRSGITSESIIEVALIRSIHAAGLDFRAIKRYDGMSDVLSSTVKSCLYLVWKTV